MTADVELDALLEQTRWLAGLARQLVRNEHDADDLVQDTLRTAVERPPASARPVRGWLRTVLLSRWRDRHREEHRRAHREAAVAAARGTAPDPADVVFKAEAHRALVEAVLALAEPYRTCVLLRFFENLPPRTIARRTHAPVATVHSRLQRALAQLRHLLHGMHGDRWQRALAPLLGAPFLANIPLGVPLVSTSGKVAFGAAVLVVFYLVWSWPPTPSLRDARVAAAPAATAATPGAAANEASAARGERSDAELPGAATSADRPAAAERRVHGRVLDVRGAGVAGVSLAFDRGGEPTVGTTLLSGAGGAFDAAAPRDAGSIAARDVRWSTVLAGTVRASADQQCTVVVAPRLDLAGRAVDANGLPVAGAAVSAHMPAQLGADLGVLLDFSTPKQWRSVCDAEGRFRLADVPAVASASLVAELGGYLPRIVALPESSTELLELVLERPAVATSVVDGLVVDEWGAAVAGARVSAGASIARSDARGAFTLELGGAPAGRLVALASGRLPAVFTPERDAAGKPQWPRRVVLQLGGAPRSLAGHVRFADGRPAKGARVWIADPMLVGNEDDVVLAENVLGREDRRFWNFAVTGDDGAFLIDGLCDRPYVVRAMDLHSLLEVTEPGVGAGRSDVALTLAGTCFPRLEVRVVTRDGAPVADVEVRLQRPALEVQVPGGTRDEWASGQSGHTGARGEFTFTDVPSRGVELFASGDTIMFAGKFVEPDIDPAAFVLTVDRRMHLQVELAAPVDRADRCRVLDAEGRAMLLRIMRGNAATTNRSAEIADGRTHILSLGEGARTVVLLRGDQEIARQPVQLVAGEVTTVRF